MFSKTMVKTMSSISKYLILLSCLLSGCATQIASNACDLGNAAAAPRPSWIGQTAFEMRLPQGYYYGKGASSLRENYAQRRDEALAQAYADIARRVSVKIFSRQVVQTTTQETRAEAITKAITDLNAHGIETIREWHDTKSCVFHVMTRVPEKVAQSWKSAASAYLVERPGLGLVRRADEDIYRLRYREMGRPEIFIQWEAGENLQKFTQGANDIFQNAVRRHLKKYGIDQLSSQNASAKIVIKLKVAGVSDQIFVVHARLISRNGSEIAAAVGDGDYSSARARPTFAPRRGGGFESQQTSRPARGAYLRQIAGDLTLRLIRDWLDNEQTTRR